MKNADLAESFLISYLFRRRERVGRNQINRRRMYSADTSKYIYAYGVGGFVLLYPTARKRKTEKADK